MTELEKRFQEVFGDKTLSFGADCVSSDGMREFRKNRWGYKNQYKSVQGTFIARICGIAYILKNNGLFETSAHGKVHSFGHPVTLEDVMLKLGEKGDFTVDCTGKIDKWYDKDCTEAVCDWNLKGKQTPETCQKLLDLVTPHNDTRGKCYLCGEPSTKFNEIIFNEMRVRQCKKCSVEGRNKPTKEREALLKIVE